MFSKIMSKTFYGPTILEISVTGRNVVLVPLYLSLSNTKRVSAVSVFIHLFTMFLLIRNLFIGFACIHVFVNCIRCIEVGRNITE